MPSAAGDRGPLITISQLWRFHVFSMAPGIPGSGDFSELRIIHCGTLQSGSPASVS